MPLSEHYKPNPDSELHKLPPFYPGHEDASPLDLEQQNLYAAVVLAAKHAYTNPVDSGFQVRTAAAVGIVSPDGTGEIEIVTGGNQEVPKKGFAYVHGETATLARIRAEFGDARILALGFYMNDLKPDAVPSPCGPCREVLQAECDPDMPILAGDEKGIFYRPLSTYFSDNRHAFNPDLLESGDYQKGLTAAIRGAKSGVKMFLPDDESRGEVYGIALVGKEGIKDDDKSAFTEEKIWRGSYHNVGAYLSTDPGLAAVHVWRNTIPEDVMPEQRGDLAYIIAAAPGGIPNIWYPDRQILGDFDSELRTVFERETPLPVVLVHFDQNSEQIISTAQTDTDELLVDIFTASTIGLQNEVRNQHLALYTKK